MDSVSLEVFKHLFASAAEEMGVALGRTAYSPNIKERLDYSCAAFTGDDRLLAQAAHIPVHLGAMPASVRAALQHCAPLQPGDVVILNDPVLGGTHLPDITLVSPVFTDHSPTAGLPPPLSNLKGQTSNPQSPPARAAKPGRAIPNPQFLVASRAHHADVGGMSPGSMPLSTEVYQEGLILPPVKLVESGRRNEAVWQIILRNVRTPDERRGDLAAQLAAHQIGANRLHEIVARYGLAETLSHADSLIAYAERLTRAAIAAIPDGEYAFTDVLDDDGALAPDAGTPPITPIKGSNQDIAICATIRVAGERLTVDFSGTAPAAAGNINAVRAIAESAVMYALRCVAGAALPMNAGVFAPVEIRVPSGSLLDPHPPHAVAAGNVETSQRIVDVLFGALAAALPETIPAASQGTMNNLTFGGRDPVRRQAFAYYETMGGGAGAGPGAEGASGVHVHMSNTRNTPVEALEYAYPLRVEQYCLRRGSGGAGRHRGGEGLRRDIRFLAPVQVTVLSERRRHAPWGLAGGGPGAPGRNLLLQNGEEIELPGKFTRRLEAGDVLSIRSPGGGGWGAAR
jgi:N-methylhydantoinase B